MGAGRTTKLYGGVPIAERRAGRREALIRAAVAVYGERGYRSATVKAVCEAAGLTERYFYESFPNSEALLVACYEAVIAAMLGEMRAAAAATAERDRTAAVLRAYFELLRREPGGARVFLVEIAGVSSAVDAVSGAALKAFGQLLDAVAGAGDGREPSPALLRAGVTGGVIHVALRWIAGGYAEPVERVVALAGTLCAALGGGDHATARGLRSAPGR